MNKHANDVISALGGTAAVSRLCGVSMPSVSDWKKDGIPRARMMFLRAIRAKELSGLDLSGATSSAGPLPELAPKKRRTTTPAGV
jgi:hypothetical protein